MFLSGVYLFVCCVLGYSLVIGNENAIGFGSALILSTAPWSFWLAKLFPFDDHTFLLILAASALINAIILYFVGLLITNLILALRGKRAASQD
jgi:hypothetical protein